MKTEMKLHNLTRKDLSDYLGQFGFGYARDSSSDSGRHGYSLNQITRFCNGDNMLPDDAAQCLAAWWGVRVDYLKGLDDWRTENDLLQLAPLQDRKAFDASRSYLETLGLTLKPFVGSYVHISCLRRDWETLREHVTDADKLEKLYALSDRSPEQYKKDCQRRPGYISIRFLSAPKGVAPDFSMIGKTEQASGSGNGFDFSPQWNIDYSVGFEIVYGDRPPRVVSVRKLQDFMQKLDKFALCAIETILLDDKNYLLG